jgi:hypothetical protein
VPNVTHLRRPTLRAPLERALPALLALLAALLGAVATPPPARADIRIWEENADDADNHRWLDFTGFAQPGFIYRTNDPESPISDDNFWLQRARIGYKAQIHRLLLLRFEIEGSPNPNLTDVYLDLPFHQAFQLRVGQFLVPFLRTYQINEVNQAFIDRIVYTPQAPDRPALRYLNPRDIGVMAFGTIGNTDPERMAPALQYWAGVFLGRGANQIVNDDNAFLYSARLNVHLFGVPRGQEQESDLADNPVPKVALGGGGYMNCDDRGNWNRGLTFDAEFRFRGIYAYGSFVRFYNGGTNGSSFGRAFGYDRSCGGGVTGAGSHVAWGWSFQVQYVLPKLLFPVEKQALELLLRFDGVAPLNPADGSFLGGGPGTPGYQPPPNYQDADNPPTKWRMTLGINWFPTREQTLRLGLNYQLNRETEDAVIRSETFVGISNDIVWLQATVAL